MESTLNINIPTGVRHSLATFLMATLEGKQVIIDRNRSNRNMVHGVVRRIVSPDSGTPDFFKFYMQGDGTEYHVHTKNDTVTVLG